MKTYILKKDTLAHGMAGKTHIVQGGLEFSPVDHYYKNPGTGWFYPANFVENNPDWFELKTDDVKMNWDRMGSKEGSEDEVIRVTISTNKYGTKIAEVDLNDVLRNHPDCEKSDPKIDPVPAYNIGNEPFNIKPPIGVYPQFIWREERVRELAKAIERYQKFLIQLREEMMEHNHWLSKREHLKMNPVMERNQKNENL